MTKRVRLLDVARAAGVSQGTASNAFGKPDLVRAEVRERILRVARELGYRGPHVMARMLRTGRAGALGVVFPDNLEYAFTDPVAIELLRGIGVECARRAYNMMIISAENPQQAIAAVNNAAVDGFLVHCYSDDNAIVSAILRRNLPMVSIDTDIAGTAGTVVLDDFTGAAQAADHLIGRGARHFAILSLKSPGSGGRRGVGAANRTIDGGMAETGTVPVSVSASGDGHRRHGTGSHRVVRERMAGYLDRLAKAGISPDQVQVIECENLSSRAAERTARLLQDHPEIDGILAMSDVMAIGALQGARQIGRQVPDDVQIIGYDGIAEGERTEPRLTTIRQNSVEKGRLAAEIVLADILGSNDEAMTGTDGSTETATVDAAVASASVTASASTASAVNDRVLGTSLLVRASTRPVS